MNKLKRFYEPIFREQKYFWKIVFEQTTFSAYVIFNVVFIKEVVSIIGNQEIEKLRSYIIVYLIISVIYFIIRVLIRHWGWAEYYFQHCKEIHNIYVKKINDIDNTYIENIGTGKAISVISKGISTWSDLLIMSIQIPVSLILSLITTIFLSIEISLYYIFSFLVVFLFMNVILYFLNQKVLSWRSKRITTENEYDRQLTKMVMSKFEILQNNKISRELLVLDKYADTSTFYNVKMNNYMSVMFLLPDVLIFFMILGIFYFIFNFKIGYDVLISIFMIISLLKQNIFEFVRFFKDFTKSFGLVERLWNFVDNGPEIKGLNTGKDFEYKTGNIKIKNLNFSYGENKVFDDFSIDFEGGKKIALVGISGSGKTTLVKLISGFLSFEEGKIIVDGQNLKEINLKSYYKNIGYLTQEPSVFDGTILENLTYGVEISPPARGELEGCFQEKILQAIKDAKCEFIYDFKDGLNTEIGERGVRLSGGQKQRLAIAKLFIKNPHIIILDEPTSALDSFSEEAIRISFEKLFAGKTVFIIAHRLQTVKEADDIIVFESGKIVERGIHTSLIKHKGYYKKMLDLQSGF